MRRAKAAAFLVASCALLPGCPSVHPGPIQDHEVAGCALVESGRTTLIFRASELPELAPPAAERVVRELDLVRARVQTVLRREAPGLEVRVWKDVSLGNDPYDVTHAHVLSKPQRVSVECPIREGESPEAFIERVRSRIAHEVAEATVITRARVLDPYLRWMHDGIAVLSEFLVESEVSAAAGIKRLEGYRRDFEGAGRRGVKWLDLTRWRQLAQWIVHSEPLLVPPDKPLELDDVDAALDRLKPERHVANRPEIALRTEALLQLIGEHMRKRAMPLSEGEADPSGWRRNPDSILFYHASFALWLDLERARPGALVRALDAIEADGKEHEILTSDAVAGILSRIAGEDVRPRLLRWKLRQAEGVLVEETERLRKRERAEGPKDGGDRRG